MRLSRYGGSPNIGVFTAANESFAFAAANCDDQFVRDVEEALNVECTRMTVAGSYLIGSLTVMNSNGAVVSGLAEEHELEAMRRFLPVMALDDRLNAAGNNILANDYGAIVNPNISDSSIRSIEGTLGVECVRSAIAGIETPGAACRVTNKGIAVHMGATEEDMALIADVLRVEPYKTTLNHGSRLIAPCVIANSKGALIGDTSTPIEMGRLEEALKLY
ncbi:MAG: translation initiation factor IF-6 [Candidatus Methanomethylophilaceae archaeon]|nr:translation initiation factor IF-6 [Candidatus Methanomethylophilaceae archaeon]